MVENPEQLEELRSLEMQVCRKCNGNVFWMEGFLKKNLLNFWDLLFKARSLALLNLQYKHAAMKSPSNVTPTQSWANRLLNDRPLVTMWQLHWPRTDVSIIVRERADVPGEDPSKPMKGQQRYIPHMKYHTS